MEQNETNTKYKLAQVSNTIPRNESQFRAMFQKDVAYNPIMHQNNLHHQI